MPPLKNLPARTKRPGDEYVYGNAIPFVLAHLVCFAAIWTGVHAADLLIAVALYVVRMFGITAGFHRYFAHRGYKTGRVFGFILAFLGQTSAQSGVLWWAGNHRHHHRFSDTDEDVHSPVKRGFWFAHLGWIFTKRYERTDMTLIPDFAKYPELVWLDRHPFLPAILLAVGVLAAAGWSGLVVGFFWSTVALWHGTFAINSLAHVIGRKRYLTGDESRNNWWLAILTLGEGWHNNHHHFQSAACQGFRWYEIDISYYVLKALAAVGVVRELRRPPAPVVRNEQRLGRIVVEKAAGELAASFKIDPIVAELRASLDTLQDDWAARVEAWRHQFDEKVETVRHDLEEMLAGVHLPAMPTVADLRERAGAMFVGNPSANDIVERARQILLENLCLELTRQPIPVKASQR
ncbi:MAG: fatty acid desaturase [Rhodospirillales bacterium]